MFAMLALLIGSSFDSVGLAICIYDKQLYCEGTAHAEGLPATDIDTVDC